MRTAIGVLSTVLVTVLAATTACSGLGGSAPQTRQWADGPVRWLLLPAEERELQNLRSDAEGRLFRDEFWRRRDPRPETPDNPARDAFQSRVRVADEAYGHEGTRGSLTDRGRALVLLGPPPLLRHGRRKVPAWRPGQRLAGRAKGGAMPVRELVAETWEYGRADLPASLLAILDERDEPGVTLLFLLESDRARLVEGDKFLEWASQAWVPLAAASPEDGPAMEGEPGAPAEAPRS